MHPVFADVSRETIDKLGVYASLLQQWQQHMNLVSAATLPELWDRHFADSAQLIPLLPDRSAVIADIGSGAGFPGLVLSILGFSNVHLIESDRRKCAFLQEAARITGASVTIHTARMESVILPPVDVFTSRACSNLSNLLNILRLHLQKNSFCLFHKGKNYTKELEDVTGWAFDLSIHPSRVADDSVILEIRNITQGVTS